MDLKRVLSVSFLLCAAWLSACAQDYKPAKGETVVKLAVEGRGNVFIKLFTKEAPKTTKHIVELVKKGFYDRQRFFRVVTSPRPYIVQMGDPATKDKDLDDPSVGQGTSGTKIPYEDTKFHNDPGTVGLAHPDQERDAGDCQFYVNLAQNRFLDGSYTVFGQVIDSSMPVVNKIQRGDRVTKATVLVGPSK
jgi:cyclophilin family peptidyl-prolyl cis-trans isomerase